MTRRRGLTKQATGYRDQATGVVMRTRGRHLNRFRAEHPSLGKSPDDALWGYFVIPFSGAKLRVISSGEKRGVDPLSVWEHVSVSLPNRCPTWDEMCAVKNLFWEKWETVLQFHPTAVRYVNYHPYCLHLWKKSGVDHELPPDVCVGPTDFKIESLVTP